jgi:hypothetical protein
VTQNLLIRALALFAGIIVMWLSITYLTERRQRFGKHTIAGIFLLVSSLALFIEAATRVGEFGIVGGVMLLFGGLASALGHHQNEES